MPRTDTPGKVPVSPTLVSPQAIGPWPTSTDGAAVGDGEGVDVDGESVGHTEGNVVIGNLVGAAVGMRVGCSGGSSDGEGVGMTEGISVGGAEVAGAEVLEVKVGWHPPQHRPSGVINSVPSSQGSGRGQSYEKVAICPSRQPWRVHGSLMSSHAVPDACLVPSSPTHWPSGVLGTRVLVVVTGFAVDDGGVHVLSLAVLDQMRLRSCPQPVPRAQSPSSSASVQRRPPAVAQKKLACRNSSSCWQPICWGSDVAHGHELLCLLQLPMAVSLQHRTSCLLSRELQCAVSSVQPVVLPQATSRQHGSGDVDDSVVASTRAVGAAVLGATVVGVKWLARQMTPAPPKQFSLCQHLSSSS